MSISVGSWSVIAQRLQEVVQASAVNLRVAGRRGLRQDRDGTASSQAQMRLFGADEGQVRVVLYRDNHAWCPYCHKVWMQLEEKQIPYRVEKVSMNCYGAKRRDFLSKTPRGLLPAVEIDGRFMTESSSIMKAIEETFTAHRSLMDASTGKMMFLERELFGAWLDWLRGEDSSRARQAFERAMDATEQALASSAGPYFTGNEPGLVDCVFASSLERIAASILYYKGMRVRGGRWPKVDAWFCEMETRDSYKASRSDFHTHVHDLPPQIGGCLASGTPEQQAAAAAIDGTDGKSWHLPLPPLTPDSLEPGSEEPIVDRLEAAVALLHCHEGVLKSSRVATEPADSALRYVCSALIEGVEELQRSPQALAHGNLDTSAAAALRWTRDRICVPRDMSFPAARQLRAHLNWAADIIDPQDGWQGFPIPVHDRRDSDPAIFGAAL